MSKEEKGTEENNNSSKKSNKENIITSENNISDSKPTEAEKQMDRAIKAEEKLKALEDKNAADLKEKEAKKAKREIKKLEEKWEYEKVIWTLTKERNKFKISNESLSLQNKELLEKAETSIMNKVPKDKREDVLKFVEWFKWVDRLDKIEAAIKFAWFNSESKNFWNVPNKTGTKTNPDSERFQELKSKKNKTWLNFTELTEFQELRKKVNS